MHDAAQTCRSEESEPTGTAIGRLQMQLESYDMIEVIDRFERFGTDEVTSPLIICRDGDVEFAKSAFCSSARPEGSEERGNALLALTESEREIGRWYAEARFVAEDDAPIAFDIVDLDDHEPVQALNVQSIIK